MFPGSDPDWSSIPADVLIDIFHERKEKCPGGRRMKEHIRLLAALRAFMMVPVFHEIESFKFRLALLASIIVNHKPNPNVNIL
jgi:hypothetical protein